MGDSVIKRGSKRRPATFAERYLEPEVVRFEDEGWDVADLAAISAAVSLKRIADNIK